jgi:hypothetical protein
MKSDCPLCAKSGHQVGRTTLGSAPIEAGRSAPGDVCFVPIADIASLFDPSIRAISNRRCSEADSLALGD